MKIISPANETILKILEKHKKTGERSRLMDYCMEAPVEDGVLLYNLLTKELLLLSREEREVLTELEELKERWFVVPEETKEKELVDLIRWILDTRKKRSSDIVSYTVFTDVPIAMNWAVPEYP